MCSYLCWGPVDRAALRAVGECSGLIVSELIRGSGVSKRTDAVSRPVFVAPDPRHRNPRQHPRRAGTGPTGIASGGAARQTVAGLRLTSVTVSGQGIVGDGHDLLACRRASRRCSRQVDVSPQRLPESTGVLRVSLPVHRLKGPIIDARLGLPRVEVTSELAC
jgi:hypothetical protein